MNYSRRTCAPCTVKEIYVSRAAHLLRHAEEFVQVRGALKHFVTGIIFKVRGC
jgi:hypothetical protein